VGGKEFRHIVIEEGETGSPEALGISGKIEFSTGDAGL
jgi:hypothetical protein